MPTHRTVIPMLAVLTALGVAALAQAKAPSTAKHHATTASYDLVFSITKGHYDANATTTDAQGCASHQDETDDFEMYSYYNGLKIPLKGAASSAIHLPARNAFTLNSTWTMSGKGTGNCVYGGIDVGQPWSCNGQLERDESEPALLLSRAGGAAKTLHLGLQSGQLWTVDDPSGNFTGGCAFVAQHRPFTQGRIDPDDLPDMLAAHVDLSLVKLRAMKSGARTKMAVSLEADRKPPFSCSEGLSVCSQHLAWTGKLSITRVAGG